MSGYNPFRREEWSVDQAKVYTDWSAGYGRLCMYNPFHVYPRMMTPSEMPVNFYDSCHFIGVLHTVFLFNADRHRTTVTCLLLDILTGQHSRNPERVNFIQ